MSARRRSSGAVAAPVAAAAPTALPALRFEVPEAAQILRMSRTQVYNRIGEGTLQAQKDGARTYIALVELQRYVAACPQSNIGASD